MHCFRPVSIKILVFVYYRLYDIPAVVDYVLNVTKARKVHYLPFSLGSTSFFAGLSKRNELSDKIALGIVLGPSTFQTVDLT